MTWAWLPLAATEEGKGLRSESWPDWRRPLGWLPALHEHRSRCPKPKERDGFQSIFNGFSTDLRGGTRKHDEDVCERARRNQDVTSLVYDGSDKPSVWPCRGVCDCSAGHRVYGHVPGVRTHLQGGKMQNGLSRDRIRSMKHIRGYGNISS